MLIGAASEAKELPVFRHLQAEAQARNIIKIAEAKARAVRAGKGVNHAERGS